MEAINITALVQTPQQPTPRKRRPATATRIAAAALKAGLFIGTAAVACQSIVLAVKFAQARASLPGGEIFTLPLIVVLFVAGYVLRGDVERKRRRKRLERRAQRRRVHEQRGE